MILALQTFEKQLALRKWGRCKILISPNFVVQIYLDFPTLLFKYT